MEVSDDSEQEKVNEPPGQIESPNYHIKLTVEQFNSIWNRQLLFTKGIQSINLDCWLIAMVYSLLMSKPLMMEIREVLQTKKVSPPIYLFYELFEKLVQGEENITLTHLKQCFPAFSSSEYQDPTEWMLVFFKELEGNGVSIDSLFEYQYDIRTDCHYMKQISQHYLSSFQIVCGQDMNKMWRDQPETDKTNRCPNSLCQNDKCQFKKNIEICPEILIIQTHILQYKLTKRKRKTTQEILPIEISLSQIQNLIVNCLEGTSISYELYSIICYQSHGHFITLLRNGWKTTNRKERENNQEEETCKWCEYDDDEREPMKTMKEVKNPYLLFYRRKD